MPKIRLSSSALAILLVALAAQQVSSPADRFAGSKAGEQRVTGGIQLCWCPAGRFRMGSPGEEPDHRSDEEQVDVTLSHGFWMGKYEVTQSQWSRIVGAFPHEMDKGAGDDFPMYWVNYTEAEEFAGKLTAEVRKTGELPRDWEFRLPTEAQWEYACRAGTVTATSFGNKLGNKQANFAGKPYNGGEPGPSPGRASRVGAYLANAWGLNDMHGNVYEWCRDWYHRRLPGGIDPDLSGARGTPKVDGTFSRVRRGGGFGDDGLACRSARRHKYEPERRADHIGFRVVAVPTSN
jgi:formylglycine-generating enzyme required for sulfatase activity